MSENVRDIYEVANQLGGYVGPGTEKRLAKFLLRESEEASILADRIDALERENTELRAALSAARPTIFTREMIDESSFGKGCSPATPLLATIDTALRGAKEREE